MDKVVPLPRRRPTDSALSPAVRDHLIGLDAGSELARVLGRHADRLCEQQPYWGETVAAVFEAAEVELAARIAAKDPTLDTDLALAFKIGLGAAAKKLRKNFSLQR